MSRHKAITDRILEQLRCSPKCELEELVCRCQEFTWHETLLELVRVNRTGSWSCRRMAGESLTLGCAPQVSTIKSNT
jgi:hypothetical protein